MAIYSLLGCYLANDNIIYKAKTISLRTRHSQLIPGGFALPEDSDLHLKDNSVIYDRAEFAKKIFSEVYHFKTQAPEIVTF